jgi:hypothetical protein
MGLRNNGAQSAAGLLTGAAGMLGFMNPNPGRSRRFLRRLRRDRRTLQCLHSAEGDMRAPNEESGFDPLLPSAIQSSCVAVFLFDQLVRVLSRIDVGTSRPSALAVVILSTVSYFTDNCTGRSAGFSLLRMRST